MLNSVPKRFGGLGGVSGGRALDPHDAFEATVNLALGETNASR
jgi:hypothetical protein